MWVVLRQCGLLLSGFGLGFLTVAGWGCATPSARSAVPYDYFVSPLPNDAWSPKIAGWQAREARMGDTDELRAPASVSGSGDEAQDSHVVSHTDLRDKYFAYRAENKRKMARELAQWIQEQARQHYVPDGPLDHWATLEETLRHDGDDCDGLELLTYHFLLDLGFSEREVFRAIVFRPSDGQHHMVTLWFEDPNDPWVLDPTGAMTSRMLHMSEAAGWVPLKVFSESEEYTAQAVRGINLNQVRSAY